MELLGLIRYSCCDLHPTGGTDGIDTQCREPELPCSHAGTQPHGKAAGGRGNETGRSGGTALAWSTGWRERRLGLSVSLTFKVCESELIRIGLSL